MITFNQMRSRIDKNNPVTNRNQNGVDIPLTPEERAAWLDEAAATALEAVAEWQEIRSRRNSLLAASDWTQIADAPVDAKAWAAYRQALRDLPESITDPTQPVGWPEPPK
jgi:hypothetical protein